MRFFLALVIFLSPVFAQEVEQREDEESSAAESQEVEIEGEEVPNSNNEEVLSPEANTDSRFIPTEQISQDLGVSYPVDI
tara:strand:- start:722 stop:961 length:240 start_codon:yes stop_codon:yes gene_type:complete